jgi:hypothetical protein
MKITTLLVSSLFLVALTSCSQRLTDFTIISSKNINISSTKELKKGKNRVEGRDIKHIFVFFPTGIPNVKEALDKAIETTPGAVALTDGTITHKYWYFPYVYGRDSYVVEGTPLIDPKLLDEK